MWTSKLKLMVTIDRFVEWFETRERCVLLKYVLMPKCSLHSSNTVSWKVVHELSREKKKLQTHKILGTRCNPCNDTHIPNIEDWWILVCCAGLFDQLCIKVHVSISRERKEGKNQQPTHRRFLSIHRSCFNRIVASFLRTVFSFFGQKLCHSIVVAHVEIFCASRPKTMHKNGTKNVRATSYSYMVSVHIVCTNFCTFKSYSHALISFSLKFSLASSCVALTPFSLQRTHTHIRQTW